MTELRRKGQVKFFNSAKGYGFIIPAIAAENEQKSTVEVFVHHSAITGRGFKSLAEGEEVEYDVIQGPKGWQAANVSGPGGVPVHGDPNVRRLYHGNVSSNNNTHPLRVFSPYHYHRYMQQSYRDDEYVIIGYNNPPPPMYGLMAPGAIGSSSPNSTNNGVYPMYRYLPAYDMHYAHYSHHQQRLPPAGFSPTYYIHQPTHLNRPPPPQPSAVAGSSTAKITLPSTDPSTVGVYDQATTSGAPTSSDPSHPLAYYGVNHTVVAAAATDSNVPISSSSSSSNQSGTTDTTSTRTSNDNPVSGPSK